MDKNQLAQVKALSSVFEKLGANDPGSWARSQVREGIPQLGMFVFLKQAWQGVIDETNPDDWFDSVTENGKDSPEYFWGQLSRALESVLATGVSRTQIVPLIQLLQYNMLNHICIQLDDGGYGSDLNVNDDENIPPVRWQLKQVDQEGNVVATLDGLHEYSDGEPSNGRESGFR